jgi:hypothetical protein
MGKAEGLNLIFSFKNSKNKIKVVFPLLSDALSFLVRNDSNTGHFLAFW